MTIKPTQAQTLRCAVSPVNFITHQLAKILGFITETGRVAFLTVIKTQNVPHIKNNLGLNCFDLSLREGFHQLLLLPLHPRKLKVSSTHSKIHQEK